MFVFEKKTAEKLHKPRRREVVTELLRHGIRQLERHRHPRLLQVSCGLLTGEAGDEKRNGEW